MLLALFLACRHESRVLSAEACTTKCNELAGSNAAFCPRVCSATCAERCGDLMTRVGGGLAPCNDWCAMSCDDFVKTFGMRRDMCEWVVENRPSPDFTNPAFGAPAP